VPTIIYILLQIKQIVKQKKAIFRRLLPTGAAFFAQKKRGRKPLIATSLFTFAMS